jgi:ribosome-dependent ATPase
MIGCEHPVARIEGVTQRYGTTVALDAVSIELPAGRMVGFIGPT